MNIWRANTKLCSKIICHSSDVVFGIVILDSMAMRACHFYCTGCCKGNKGISVS
jgi:hypothetical protein